VKLQPKKERTVTTVVKRENPYQNEPPARLESRRPTESFQFETRVPIQISLIEKGRPFPLSGMQYGKGFLRISANRPR